MPNIGTIAIPRNEPETAAQQGMRSELAIFINRQPNFAQLPVDVADYITQTAARYAILNAALLYHNSERTNSMGTAKSWIVGFMDWYLDVANLLYRDDSTRQPNFLLTVESGNLIRSKLECRNIAWTDTDVNRANSLWNSDFDWRSLERVNMNLMGCVVVSWKDARRRAPGVGNIWLPGVITYKGVTLELGDEVLSDWLLPPDAGHGHPFQTLCKAFGDRKPSDLRPHHTDTATRKSYSMMIGGGIWRLVVVGVQGAVPLIITFFKEV